MKTNDFVKFLTQEFVTYTNQPKMERKQSVSRKDKSKNFSNELFGLLPMSLMMLFKKKK